MYHATEMPQLILFILLNSENESGTDYLEGWSVGVTSHKLWFNDHMNLVGDAALACWQSAALTNIMEKESEVEVSSWPYGKSEASSIVGQVSHGELRLRSEWTIAIASCDSSRDEKSKIAIQK